MAALNSGQRKYLRSQAHHLDSSVIVGKQGITENLLRSVDVYLGAHELIKVRFNDHKKEKKALAPIIAEKTNSELAGLIGHVAILYRQHPDPQKRKFTLPE